MLFTPLGELRMRQFSYGHVKTHSFVAIGQDLCQKSYNVKFYTAINLVTKLEEAKDSIFQDISSYGNKFYLINSDLKYSIAKQELEIRTNGDENFKVYFSGQELMVSEVIEPTKFSMVDLEIQKKVDAIELAEKLGNVAEAARISGVSRQTIYKNRKILEEKGEDALKRTFKKDHYHKNRASRDLENIFKRYIKKQKYHS